MFKKGHPSYKLDTFDRLYKVNENKKGYYQYNFHLIKAFVLIVGATRFELATPTTPLWCATGLRHAPKFLVIYNN